MKRVQLSRKKGFRKPDDAINVARTTKWGNPFNWRDADPDTIPANAAKWYAVESFRTWLTRPGVIDTNDDISIRRQWILEHIQELAGKDLACWCRPDEPCHADVLIELANKTPGS